MSLDPSTSGLSSFLDLPFHLLYQIQILKEAEVSAGIPAFLLLNKLFILIKTQSHLQGASNGEMEKGYLYGSDALFLSIRFNDYHFNCLGGPFQQIPVLR